MQIIFEDNHILVADKPAGIPVQPGSDGQENLEDQLKACIKMRDQKPAGVFLHALHRIDKPVAGLVLFAKSKKALTRLSESMRSGAFVKKYRAFVHGKFTSATGTFVDRIEKKEHHAVISPRGKQSELAYRVIEEKNDFSLVEVVLATGRYHQIRVQMASRGHPIVGDAKYGSSRPWRQGIALVHYSMEFPHPITGERIAFISNNEIVLTPI